MKWASSALVVMPVDSPKPDCTAMILLRTITRGSILRNFIASRSKIPMPAPLAIDWTHSRRYEPSMAINTRPTIRTRKAPKMSTTRTTGTSAKSIADNDMDGLSFFLA